MGRLERTIDPVAFVSDPDIVPSPKSDYWLRDFVYRQIVNQSAETNHVPLDEWRRFREGLEADKGECAVVAFQTESSRARSKKHAASQAFDNPEQARQPPFYVVTLLRLQGSTLPFVGGSVQYPLESDMNFSSWRFVVFRTTGYGKEDSRQIAKA